MIKQRSYSEVTVSRVLGPDMFEAAIDVGFDVIMTRRLRLLGVDSDHVRNMDPDNTRQAIEFFRGRVEGNKVELRVTRKGEYYYARVLYGSDNTDLLDEMSRSGLLRKFERNGNGNGDEQ
jgi:hypothetical protein